MVTWVVIALLGVFAVWTFAHRYPQFGLLAASAVAMLVLSLFATINTVAVVAFVVLWILGLIVAVMVTAIPGTFMAILTAAFALAIILIPSLSAVNSSVNTNIGGAAAQAAAPAGTGTAPKTCDAAFTQQWDPNTGNRFASNGLWDNPATHTATPAGVAKNQETLVGHDARYLASSLWTVGLWDNPNNVAPLMSPDKSCLSTQGIALEKQLVQKWDSAQAAITAAPANGTNTGSDNGKFVASANSGITGDRTAIKRTYPDGRVTYDLVRCGNHVLPGKPSGVPSGRTDTHTSTPPGTSTTPGTPTSPPTQTTTPPVTTTTTPPVTTTTTPPVTTTTPPVTTTTTPPVTTTTTTPPVTTTTPQTCDNGGTPPACLQPKGPGNNPTGKSPVGPPPGAPETSAPVETNPANPTDHPGDPVTSGTAPGATQDPTRVSSDPVPTVAPGPTDPGTTINDPDGSTPSAAGALFFLPALGGGFILRRKRDKKKTANK